MHRRAVGIIVTLTLALALALVCVVEVALPSAVATASPHPTSAFVPLPPTRVADTRSGAGIARIDQHTIRVDMDAVIGIDAPDATAAALTITLIASEGYVSVTPAGRTGTSTSVVNARIGSDAVTASTIARLGRDGAVDVYASSPDAHVIVDVSGAFVPANSSTSGRFVAIDHVRALDTRAGNPVSATSIVSVALPRGVPHDAVAVAVNVTALADGWGGFATLYPAGSAPPDVSQLNVGTAQVAAASSIVPVSPDGLQIATSFSGHLVVDVTGYFTGPEAGDDTVGLYVALDSPVRRLDSRTSGVIHPGGAVEVGVPTPGGSLAGTITMVDAQDWGFVTVSPAGVRLPDTSSVNADRPGDAAANLTLTGISDRGLAVYSHAGSHVIVDQTGWFTGPRSAAYLPVPENLPRPPEYPTGRCDSSATGMEPLALPPGQYPDQLVEIGRSVQGRPIWAEYWGPSEPVHTVLVISQIHADECSTNRLTRAIRERPPTSNGIWLIPVMNPDGYAAGTRDNANRVDLNADGWSVGQPETAAVMGFTALVQPDLTVHLHSPNGFVGWFGDHRAQWTAQAVAGATGMQWAPAGARPDRSRWFLWQGQQRVHPHPAVLIELFAVANSEVPHAHPRPPTQSVATVDAHAHQILDILATW